MSLRATAAALLLASAGAILVMVDVLGTVGSVAGLVAIVLGTVLAAPAARGAATWWSLLAAGAVLSAVGALVALGSDVAGGVIALIGGVAVLAGAAFGWPAESGGADA